MSNLIDETDTIEALPPDNDSLRVTLSHIFADLDEAVVVADEHRRIVMINPAMQQLFGYAQHELLGRSAELIHGDDNDFVARARAHFDAHARLKHSSYLSRYKRRDGSLFDAETVVGPIRDPGDGDMLYLGIIRDVSVRRPAEKALSVLHAITTDQELDFAQRRHAILDLGCNYFGLATGIISRIDGDRYEVVDVIDADGVIQRGDTWRVGGTYSGCVLERNGPFGVDGTNRARLRRQLGTAHARPESYIGCPITVAGERHGTLDFCSLAGGGLFGPSDFDLVATLAQRIGQDILMERRLAALRNVHDKLSRVATVDELTGLGNRRLLVRQLDFEIERGRRHRRSLSQAAAVSLSRLLESIRSHPLETEGRSISLSVSAGVTSSACNESSDTIIRRADDALRQAKAAGCNQVAQLPQPDLRACQTQEDSTA